MSKCRVLLGVTLLIGSAAVRADLPTGGEILQDGNYRLHVFTNSGIFETTFDLDQVEILVVGGGGGGASGGGGAGGLRYTNIVQLSAAPYTVTVGAGGIGKIVSNPLNPHEADGEESAFGSMIAKGGGGGSSTSVNGRPGGSGGGGGAAGNMQTYGGLGTGGEGNAGGGNSNYRTTPFPSGGGGGAGGDGASAPSGTEAGSGGNGLEYPQFALAGGHPAGWFAGGGGGATYAADTDGSGGSGGGGAGAGNTETGKEGWGEPGKINTGGGGGGTRGISGATGGKGGSGIVIVRYSIDTVSNVNGATNVTANSGWLNGRLIDDSGQSTAAWVYWGANDGGTNTGAWGHSHAFGNVAVGPLTVQASGLEPNTLYFYRYAVSNSATDVAWSSPSSAFITAPVTVEATNPNASKATGATGAFTVTRPAALTNAPLRVFYSMSGSAVNGQDYETLSGQILIPEGATQATVTITPIATSDAGEQTATLTLRAGPHTLVAPFQDTVTIADAWTGLVPGETNVWTGAGNWQNEGGWSLGRLPSGGDFVVISNAITISASPPILSALTVHANVLVQGWNTRLAAYDIDIEAGWLTHAVNTDTDYPWVPDNRLQIIARDIRIAAGAGIDVSAKGYGSPSNVYAAGYGPGGGGHDAGGGYGGYGGRGFNDGLPGEPYGSETEPVDPGSGGGADGGGSGGSGGRGGGAVWIEADSLTLNGSILADGGNWGGVHGGGGSGGGIYIRVTNIAGSETGVMRARGGNASGSGTTAQTGGGGGGRVAIHYASRNTYLGTATTPGGLGGEVTGYGIQNGEPGTVYWGVPPEGTLILIR